MLCVCLGVCLFGLMCLCVLCDILCGVVWLAVRVLFMCFCMCAFAFVCVFGV